MQPSQRSRPSNASGALTRRTVLGVLGGAAGGALLTHGSHWPVRTDGAQSTSQAGPSASDATATWTYHLLDSQSVADTAYRVYPDGACMYAVFGAIIGTLAEKHGPPYDAFPLAMMRYGHGGVDGWGSLCGACNAAGALFGLFVSDEKKRTALVDALLHWYEVEALPTYEPNGDAEAAGWEIPTSRAGSVLCHISTSRWAAKANLAVRSPQRKERCRRLAASVAGHVVTLLNEHAEGIEPAPLVSDGNPMRQEIVGKMNCTMCHDHG